MYECNSQSLCKLVSFENASLKLVGETKVGSDGVRVKLNQARPNFGHQFCCQLFLTTNDYPRSDGLKSAAYISKKVFLNRQPCFKASIRGIQSMNELDGDEPEPAKQPSKRAPKYIQPLLDNFRRSKRGFKLMWQEVAKLLRIQGKTFPNKAMVNLDGTWVTWNYSGQSGKISMEELGIKVPAFFDSYFVNIRKRIDFGHRVQKWINDVEKQMVVDYKQKGMHELIFLIATSQLAKAKGFEQPDTSEGEDD